ncbi:hypothetical protein [Ferrimonas aestuarii]|uniref:Lipoprotein n=1 Tax=Ferrimonas aestuarii TaxID=2569539 RepID=A0A4U1BLL1_9GAMM|nr:hypothetical protein [Ferrimonas aestuarii]TKB53004.1 hypothetical protein FCL42_15080 [Ferrimonas aestuarii]
MLNKLSLIVLMAVFVSGCSTLMHHDCNPCKELTASSTERDQLWAKLKSDQSYALNNQPRSRDCSHSRCNHTTGCR